jgi:hypothetical protein
MSLRLTGISGEVARRETHSATVKCAKHARRTNDQKMRVVGGVFQFVHLPALLIAAC